MTFNVTVHDTAYKTHLNSVPIGHTFIKEYDRTKTEYIRLHACTFQVAARIPYTEKENPGLIYWSEDILPVQTSTLSESLFLQYKDLKVGDYFRLHEDGNDYVKLPSGFINDDNQQLEIYDIKGDLAIPVIRLIGTDIMIVRFYPKVKTTITISN